MMRFIPMTGCYQSADAETLFDGLKQLQGLVDTCIVEVRPWMLEPADGVTSAFRAMFLVAKAKDIRLIPAMRPDLAAQGHGTDQPWSQKNWDEVSRLMKLAMRATKKRDFFLVMEPCFNPQYPPSRIDYIMAMKIAAYTGATRWFDRPYVDHANPDVGIGWLTDCHKHASSWWRPMRLAPAMPGTYSLLANPRSADEERWAARDAMHSIVGRKYCHDRYFVTSNGRWPGDATTDYMQVVTAPGMFDFSMACAMHSDAGDAPPVAYIHTHQFVEVCRQIREAARAEPASR